MQKEHFGIAFLIKYMLLELCNLKHYVNSGFTFDSGSNFNYRAEWLSQITLHPT